MRSKANQPKKVLFWVPSPLGISPGQRFRFEHYLPFLTENNISYKVSPFLSMRGRKRLYSPGNILGKIRALGGGYLCRLGDLFALHKYDYVYVHRWAAIAGPPFFEWMAAKVFRKKIIYDFDDSIWVGESTYNKRFLAIKFLGKIGRICRWASLVTVGNEYLKNFAVNFNKNVIIIPTVVNTNDIHNKLQEHHTNKPAVGWTGSFSTLIYLDMIVPVINHLQDKYDFTFYVIADRDPRLPVKNYQFIKWTSEHELEDLLQFHIGLMPLTDDPITRGKCGFKAIQYMSIGVPAIVSPVGVNTKIVDNGINGFIADNDSEWEQQIAKLLEDEDLRKKMGLLARKKIEEQYSVTATKDQFINIFN